jgi:hypothetical protein
MAVEGTLDLFQLPEILQVISQQKKTGILTVQGPQDIVAVSFLTGRIVAVDALNQPLEDGLAKILQSEGILNAADLARANAEHHSSGSRLVDVLVEKHFLQREQLMRAMRIQTFRLLEQLLGWKEGDFKFYSGDEVSYEEGFSPISVEELLIRAVQHATPAAQPEPPRPRPRPPAVSPPASAAPPPQIAHPAPGAERAPQRPDLRIVPGATPAPPLQPPRAVPPAASRADDAAAAEAVSPYRRVTVEERADALPHGARAGKLLGAGLAAAVLVLVVLFPAAVSLPLPWQEAEHEALQRELRASLFLKIDRAAKTFYLVRGQFPDQLSELVEARLLTAADLVDPTGAALAYASSSESYRLYPVRRGKPIAGSEVDESVTGNFLLDPELSNSRSDSDSPPLVLID